MPSITTDVDKLNVTKANKLIQINLMESKTRLSLREQKIILSVIAQINPEDDDLKDYQISINDLVKITGIQSQHLYSGIKKICTSLMSSIVTIKEPDNPEGFLMSTWFSHAGYSPSEGVVEFSVSKKLKPYLLQLKGRFTSYRLKQVMSLQSSYSIRMYELLRQFLPMNAVDKGNTTSFREISIDDLRGYLGVEDGKYPKFAMFRKNILEKCQKEITEETDLTFDFEPIRKGRKIGAIKFVIKHNQQFEAVQEDQESPVSVGTPKEMPEGIKLMLKLNIPELTDIEMMTMANLYKEEIIRDSTLDIVSQIMSGFEFPVSVKNYFYGILKQKAIDKEKGQVSRTTEERLTDRSWDDVQLNDDVNQSEVA